MGETTYPRPGIERERVSSTTTNPGNAESYSEIDPVRNRSQLLTTKIALSR